MMLADEPGLGKTLSTCLAVNSLQSYPLLVVTKGAVKQEWEREIKNYLPTVPLQVLERGTTFDASASIYVTHYQNLKVCINKLAGGFATVVFDESHELQSPDSQRVQNSLRLARAAYRVYLVTGTPTRAFPGRSLFSAASASLPYGERSDELSHALLRRPLRRNPMPEVRSHQRQGRETDEESLRHRRTDQPGGIQRDDVRLCPAAGEGGRCLPAPQESVLDPVRDPLEPLLFRGPGPLPADATPQAARSHGDSGRGNRPSPRPTRRFAGSRRR